MWSWSPAPLWVRPVYWRWPVTPSSTWSVPRQPSQSLFWTSMISVRVAAVSYSVFSTALLSPVSQLFSLLYYFLLFSFILRCVCPLPSFTIFHNTILPQLLSSDSGEWTWPSLQFLCSCGCEWKRCAGYYGNHNHKPQTNTAPFWSVTGLQVEPETPQFYVDLDVGELIM